MQPHIFGNIFTDEIKLFYTVFVMLILTIQQNIDISSQ